MTFLVNCYCRFDQCLEDFNHVLKSDPRNPIIYSNIGLVYRMKGDFKTGIDVYTKEIEFNLTSPSGFNKRGFCFAKINMF
jgi:tetratricopeptide (TPR) repeat protein